MDIHILPQPLQLNVEEELWIPPVGLANKLKRTIFSDTEIEDISFSTELESQTIGAYTLEAGASGIRIRAASSEGRWNALQTLRQVLLCTETDGRVATLKVVDEPVFPVRGVQIDISRTRVPRLETLMKLIDLWSLLKINHLQLYMEHSFAYKGHETVWKEASPYTASDIQKIDRYCFERGIELVPNQNSFGHMERWLRHSEYHKYAESPNGYMNIDGEFLPNASTLDMENPESLDLLADLYDQLLPNFRSRNFNIGGDETYDLGKGSNREKCEREGIGPVYLEHITRILKMVSSRGYVPHFYSDIVLQFPELVNEIPSDAVILNWGYEPDHPFEKETAILAESGCRFHVYPGTSSWNSLAGRYSAARENIRNAALWGRKNGATGFVCTDWGDFGHYQQYIAALPGWVAGATAAWNGRGDDDVCSWIEHFIFCNRGGKQAEKLITLGELYRECPADMHNMSFLALVLMDENHSLHRDYDGKIRKSGIGNCVEIAGELLGSLNDEQGFWEKQLHFTAELCFFAAELSREYFRSDVHKIADIPSKRRRELAEDLKPIISNYALLWMEICRGGGLVESMSGLEKLLTSLGS